MKTFNEDLNTAVIVSKWVFRKGEPILNVFHHEDDGMWEFTGATQGVEDSDYNVTGLGEAISYDSTLLAVSDLPLGYRATRPSPNDPWKFSRVSQK
ncbi:hypothetical protein [Chitinophaga ginsengisoli]|uniref:DUF2185 domain-containing protein n=1 Tax=Chitinophaga ginsengisoli TaxID=363837 RepID=A0A2P8FMN3_9BACT|nr:hypothetical protein [Chitinophaga ginsengisoli]PSL22981.1 hypothetical protein CLV42_1191 [Chitinophaga ginsengisoli]